MLPVFRRFIQNVMAQRRHESASRIQKIAVAIRSVQRISQKPYMSSDSVLSSASSSSSSASSSFFLSSSFFASSAFFFSAFSVSLRAFHFAAKASASALSSHTITLSKMVPPLTCHKSNPIKPKSAYLHTALSSSYSGLSIFLASQKPLYAGLEILFTDQSPL